MSNIPHSEKQCEEEIKADSKPIISKQEAEHNKYNDPTDDVFLVIKAMEPLSFY